MMGQKRPGVKARVANVWVVKALGSWRHRMDKSMGFYAALLPSVCVYTIAKLKDWSQTLGPC